MTTETGARLSYGIAEAAEMLGVGRTTIYELVRTGQLATLKIGHRRARKHVEQLALAEREMPLEDRAVDTWEALVAVADLAGGGWPQAARSAAVMLTNEVVEDDEDTIPVQLLADCRTIFADRQALRTSELPSELKADPAGPCGTTPPHPATETTHRGGQRPCQMDDRGDSDE